MLAWPAFGFLPSEFLSLHFTWLLAYNRKWEFYSIEKESRMEKALTKVGSLKVGSLWISKKAKEEFSNITEDITVSVYILFNVFCIMFLEALSFCVVLWFLSMLLLGDLGHNFVQCGLIEQYPFHDSLLILDGSVDFHRKEMNWDMGFWNKGIRCRNLNKYAIMGSNMRKCVYWKSYQRFHVFLLPVASYTISGFQNKILPFEVSFFFFFS